MPALPSREAIGNEGWSPEACVPAPISPHSDHGNGWVPRYQGQPRVFIQQTDSSNQPAWGPPACTWQVVQEDSRPAGHSVTHAPGPCGRWAPSPGLLSCRRASTEVDGTACPPASPTCCCGTPGGVSGSGMDSGRLQVRGQERGSGAAWPSGPCASSFERPVPRVPAAQWCRCKRGCPRPSTAPHFSRRHRRVPCGAPPPPQSPRTCQRVGPTPAPAHGAQ